MNTMTPTNTTHPPKPDPAAIVKAFSHASAARIRYKLGSVSYHLLAILASGPPVTLTALSKTLKIKTAGVTGLADSLEDKGFATRVHSSTDRRSITLEITEAGRAVFA